MALSSIGKSADITAPAIPPGPATNGHKQPPFPDGEEPAPSSYLRYLPAIFTADEFVGRFLRIFEDVLQPISAMVDNQPYYWDPLTTPGPASLQPDGEQGEDGVVENVRGFLAGSAYGSGAHSVTGSKNGTARATNGTYPAASLNGLQALHSNGAMRAPVTPFDSESTGLLDWMGKWVDMDDEADGWPLPRKRALIEAAAVLYRMRGTEAGIKLHLGIYSAGLVLIEERTNGFRLEKDSRLGINTSIGESRPRTFTVTVALPDPEALDADTLRAIIEADKPVETTYILRIVKLGVKVAKARPPRW